jgi:hypothetical protein
MLDLPDRDVTPRCAAADGDDNDADDQLRRKVTGESASDDLSHSPDVSAMDRTPMDEALVDIASDRIGWFRFYFIDERWEWSAEVQRMHGYGNGGVEVTTKLVIAHKHPEDRPRVAAMIDDMRRTHRAFGTRHRIVDTHGAVRDVVVIGDHLHDDNGRIIGTHGFYVDITLSRPERDELVNAALAEIAVHRAVIDQAKGMLMLIYRIDADQAFEILSWRSQDTNVRLRRFAEQVCTELRALEPAPFDVVAIDRVVMTAHLRINRDD